MSAPAQADSSNERVNLDAGAVREIKPRDLIVRFAFGAVTSAVSAGVTIAFGARAGGIFLAFPAILAATVTLIQDEDSAAEARTVARGAALGSIGLAAFAAIGAALFTQLAPGLVVLIAAIAWALVSVAVYVAAS